MKNETGNAANMVALVAAAPWREAVTYRDTWPHEYVLVNRDGQQDLLAAFCGYSADREHQFRNREHRFRPS